MQTELLPRCGEIAPVGQVVHENGKALLQAVLEVRDVGLLAPQAALSSIPKQHPYGARGREPSSMDGSRGVTVWAQHVVCSVAGHRWPGFPQPHGSLCRNPLCLEQALLQPPEHLDQGGHAAGWLPLRPSHSRAEGKLQPADPQVCVPLALAAVPHIPTGWE